jgi:hypothetical protein
MTDQLDYLDVAVYSVVLEEELAFWDTTVTHVGYVWLREVWNE